MRLALHVTLLCQYVEYRSSIAGTLGQMQGAHEQFQALSLNTYVMSVGEVPLKRIHIHDLLRPVVSRTRWAVSLGAAALVLATLWAVPAAASRASQSKSPYLVGIDVNLSGPLAPYTTGAADFSEAVFKYVNAHGGIDGHKIKYLVLDDKGDPGQTLLNFESLWSQDHVLAIVGGGTYTPWSYVQQNNIPVYSGNGGLGSKGFGSHYPTWFSVGSVTPVWDSQAAYWSVKIEHKAVKSVEVLYSTTLTNWNGFIQNYWKKLGATSIYMDPGGGPAANCTPLILKMKAENVQYFDVQDQEFANCILAEQQLGWKPPLGQGSPTSSQIGEAELLGKVLVGVIAGSPNTLYTGAPIYPSPTAADRTFVGTIKTYSPSYANYSFLNGTTQILYYSAAELLVDALKGTLAKYGRATSPLLVKYTETMKNWDNNLNPPVASFTPSCKTGGDGTIWGYWHFNPHPTAAKPSMYMIPASGNAWVNTRKFLGLGKCYLTQLVDAQFPNG